MHILYHLEINETQVKHILASIFLNERIAKQSGPVWGNQVPSPEVRVRRGRTTIVSWIMSEYALLKRLENTFLNPGEREKILFCIPI